MLTIKLFSLFFITFTANSLFSPLLEHSQILVCFHMPTYLLSLGVTLNCWGCLFLSYSLVLSLIIINHHHCFHQSISLISFFLNHGFIKVNQTLLLQYCTISSFEKHSRGSNPSIRKIYFRTVLTTHHGF
jgi:hypothetical protein